MLVRNVNIYSVVSKWLERAAKKWWVDFLTMGVPARMHGLFGLLFTVLFPFLQIENKLNCSLALSALPQRSLEKIIPLVSPYCITQNNTIAHL